MSAGRSPTSCCGSPTGASRCTRFSRRPPNYDRAVVEGVRDLVERSSAAPGAVEEVVHGTTVATNAVLERRGARTALVTTRGFRDVLELRRVRMPHLYDPFWTKPPPLVERELRLEVNERMSADGRGAASARQRTRRARSLDACATLGVESVAVCLLHAHRHPAHEQELGAHPARGASGHPGLALERDPAGAAGVRAHRRNASSTPTSGH